MQIHRGRLAATTLTALSLGGLLASCGSTSSESAASSSSTPKASSPVPITEASAADVDAAFVREMTPHHQMAVSMAKMALTQGEHPQVKTLAKDIIAAQTKEIAQLKTIAATLGVTPGKAMDNGAMGASMQADAATLAIPMDQMGMSMDMTKLDVAKPFDKAFIAQMTVHHKGAVTMAKAELKRGGNAKLRTIATAIIAAQENEIAEMAAWNSAWYGAGSNTPDHSGMSGM